MFKKEKEEPTLLQRVLKREKVDLAQYTMREIEQLISDLVELQMDRVRAEEVTKLVGVIDVASAKIREIMTKEK